MAAPSFDAPALSDKEAALRVQVVRLAATMMELERGYSDVLSKQHEDLRQALALGRRALDACAIMRRA